MKIGAPYRLRIGYSFIIAISARVGASVLTALRFRFSVRHLTGVGAFARAREVTIECAVYPRPGRSMSRRRWTDDSLVICVGMRIRKLRIERRMSLRDFGKHAGVHPFHVMAIELGQLSATTKTLRAIAKGLGVAPVDLLNHDPENDDMAYIVERIRQDPEVRRMVLTRLGGLANHV